MKYALIGCGMISANHIRAALETDVEIAALCDLVAENREKALELIPEDKRADVRLYEDYHLMLNELHPEVVAIALGSGLKRMIACDCMNAGANVLVEKPIALSLEEADAMIECAEKNGVKLCVNHQLRFCPSVRAIRRAAEEGEFGRMYHAAAQIRRNRNKAYFDAGKWRGTWKNDGGTMMNQCIHYTDLLQWMLGDVDEVFAYTDNLAHDYTEAEDMGLALIRFKSGAYATVEGTINTYPNNLSDSMAFFGEKGTVSVSGKYMDKAERWMLANGDAAIEDTVKRYGIESMGEGHTPVYRDFIAAIREDRDPVCSAVEGRKALEVVLAIYESAAIGKTVKLPLQRGSTMDYVGRFGR